MNAALPVIYPLCGRDIPLCGVKYGLRPCDIVPFGHG